MGGDKLSEVRTIFGIDYDELEPYVKDEYNQRVEWSALYPEWRKEHPDGVAYGDWDEVFMRETSLDYIANFMGDNFHTFFGYVVDKDSKRFMNNAVRQEIADQIRQLVNLKKKDIRKMCRFHEVMTIDESESFNGIRDLDTNEKIASTDMRINGKKFRGGKAV